MRQVLLLLLLRVVGLDLGRVYVLERGRVLKKKAGKGGVCVGAGRRQGLNGGGGRIRV